MSDRTSKDPAIIARCKLRDAASGAGKYRDYLSAIWSIRRKGNNVTVEDCRNIWRDIGIGGAS